YGSKVSGSCTKNFMFNVFSIRNGSKVAVAGCGNSVMSDSSMEVKPRTEEPSKAKPCSAASSSNSSAGMVKWCSVPGTSVKRTSKKRMPSSLMYSTTSEIVAKAMGCSSIYQSVRHSVRFLDVRFTDVPGTEHHFTIPAEEFEV